MTPTYCLYLDTPKGRETILSGEKDPRKVHRVVTGRSFGRRLKKFGHSFQITKDNKNMRFEALERICLDLWFEDEEDGDHS